MKTTIDIPEAIYRKVKAKSALEGRPVRDVAITLFTTWVEMPESPSILPESKPNENSDRVAPSWFGSLHAYAENANGRFDMDAIRRSITRGRISEAKSE